MNVKDPDSFGRLLFSLLLIVLVLFLTGARVGASETTEVNSEIWTDILLHVREGAVEGAVVGGKCLGRDAQGNIQTTGCARRRGRPLAAAIDGECWITVREWNLEILSAVLENWGHELAHCVRGAWHD